MEATSTRTTRVTLTRAELAGALKDAFPGDLEIQALPSDFGMLPPKDAFTVTGLPNGGVAIIYVRPIRG